MKQPASILFFSLTLAYLLLVNWGFINNGYAPQVRVHHFSFCHIQPTSTETTVTDDQTYCLCRAYESRCKNNLSFDIAYGHCSNDKQDIAGKRPGKTADLPAQTGHRRRQNNSDTCTNSILICPFTKTDNDDGRDVSISVHHALAEACRSVISPPPEVFII